MLSPYNVLDLSEEGALLCGQILADLGADVIQVEPVSGSPTRRLGPFAKDQQDPENSLFWWAYARNKRGIRLDLDAARDRAALLELVRSADVWIESDPPGKMVQRGFGYPELSRVNPALVYVSITPFGQAGPKAHYLATDLTLAAASGPLYLTGEAERAPVRVSVPQAALHAASDGAVAALIALHGRRRSGRGAHVDVSTQQSLTVATLCASLDAALGSTPGRRRSTGGLAIRDTFVRTLFRARDGWVTSTPGLASSLAGFMRRMLLWAHEEGFLETCYPEEDWGSYLRRLGRGELDPAQYERVQAGLERLFRSRSKLELMREAVARKLLLAPVLSVGEVVQSEQLAAREFFVSLERPGSGAARYPGPFARLERTPIRYRRPAPRLGEHQEEVLREPRPPLEVRASEGGGLPLEGVKVLDLFWIVAGPGATRMLADYGATVVHVESTRSLDTVRLIPPYHNGVPGPENSGAFQSINAGKLNITLDLRREEAQEIVRELVAWADVVTESFSPGVLRSWGLDYPSLRRIKPDLIMISSCLMGQSGPYGGFAGFGNLGASLTGLHELTGLPERPPAGPFGAYTDYIALRYNAVAILAALDHRARTGVGQYIDQSQAEAAIHFLAPAVLDYLVNGRETERIGNDDPQMVPHGVYPAAGEDRWVALAVRGQGDWQRLCALIGRAEWAPLRAPERRKLRREIDAALEGWMRDRDPAEAERELQERGIPSHRVADMTDLFRDAQLQLREHFLAVPHPLHGTTTIEGTRFRISGAPARRPERGLTFGCDNRRVLEEILGYSAESIAALAEAGVLL